MSEVSPTVDTKDRISYQHRKHKDSLALFLADQGPHRSKDTVCVDVEPPVLTRRRGLVDPVRVMVVGVEGVGVLQDGPTPPHAGADRASPPRVLDGLWTVDTVPGRLRRRTHLESPWSFFRP